MTYPGSPEKAAIARAMRPGVKGGSAATGGVVIGEASGRPGRGARTRGLADLCGDATRRSLEGLRRRHRARALRGADPGLTEVTPHGAHLRDVRHRHAALRRVRELRQDGVA